MRSKFIFSFLRISTTILYYLMIFFTVIFLVISILKVFGSDTGNAKILNNNLTYEALAFGTNQQEQPPTYSRDSVVSYQAFRDHYNIRVEPNSTMGYYSLIMKFVALGLGIGILWNFKRIFTDIKLNDPFRITIIKRLRMLAALFIISDLLKFIDYFLFNSFLRQSITSPKFELLTNVGNGIITGLIILVIATIYQRGIDLQEENALTV